MKLLKLGLACAEPDVEKRYDLKVVLEKLDEITERDGEDDYYSSRPSDADAPPTRGSGDFTFHNQS